MANSTYFYGYYNPTVGVIRECIPATATKQRVDAFGNLIADLTFAAADLLYPFPYANGLVGVPKSPNNLNPGQIGQYVGP